MAKWKRKAGRKGEDAAAGGGFDFGRRSSGLLMHVTSLPGPFGSGDLSDEARAFVDFAAAAGQSWWQMLPVGPPGGHPGNSPYSSYSSMAGSPYLVGLEDLARRGLLARDELAPPSGADERRVNFAPVRAFREQRLRAAYVRFAGGRGGKRERGAFDGFRREHREWLDDFALYCALKGRLRDAPWHAWDKPLRRRKAGALAEAHRELSGEVDYHRFVQYLFFSQWGPLREYARGRGVGLIGDVPIFVSHDSVDVWSRQDLFQLDRDGRPKAVSGVPPDMLAEDGQLWGHPQYDWKAHARDGYRWWVSRFAATFRLFDALRIDHFLGFERVWSIPAGSKTARSGKWVSTPGYELFETLRHELGDRPIIAEDLGILTPEAAQLRDAFGFPGMRVVQFGLAGGGAYHQPHGFARAAVAYTGTHDTDTAVGWFRSLKAPEKKRVLSYLGAGAQRVERGLIRSVMQSVADTAIFPVQDLLGEDGRSRMNVPGKAAGNWGWRVGPGGLPEKLAGELREMTEVYDRLPQRGGPQS